MLKTWHPLGTVVRQENFKLLTARDEQMAKILANMETEDELASPIDDNETSINPVEKLELEKLKQQELRTQQEIIKLEKAKKIASSEAVKERIQEEIKAAKVRKEEEKQRRVEQTKTFKAVKDVHDIGHTVYSDVKNNIDNGVSKVEDNFNAAKATLEGVSIPGSIWLPISVLLIFFFLLLPVKGKTRAEWLFQAAVGQAEITGNPTANTQEEVFGAANGSSPNIRTFTR